MCISLNRRRPHTQKHFTVCRLSSVNGRLFLTWNMNSGLIPVFPRFVLNHIIKSTFAPKNPPRFSHRLCLKIALKSSCLQVKVINQRGGGGEYKCLCLGYQEWETPCDGRHSWLARCFVHSHSRSTLLSPLTEARCDLFKQTTAEWRTEGQRDIYRDTFQLAVVTQIHSFSLTNTITKTCATRKTVDIQGSSSNSLVYNEHATQTSARNQAIVSRNDICIYFQCQCL